MTQSHSISQIPITSSSSSQSVAGDSCQQQVESFVDRLIEQQLASACQILHGPDQR